MYRYRLDGFDRDWSAPVAGRQAVYTNLDSRGVCVSCDGVQQRRPLERR